MGSPSPSKLASLILALTMFAGPAAAQKFYPDDPLEKEPPLWPGDLMAGVRLGREQRRDAPLRLE